MNALYFVSFITLASCFILTSPPAFADSISRNLAGIDDISVQFNHQLIKKSENRNYTVSIVEGDSEQISIAGTKVQLEELVIDINRNQLNISRDSSLFALTQTEPVQIKIETRKLRALAFDGEFTAKVALTQPHQRLAISVKEGTTTKIANLQADKLYLDVKYGCPVTLDQPKVGAFFADVQFGSNVTISHLDRLTNLELKLAYGSTWSAANTTCEHCKLSADAGSSINFNSLESSATKARTGSSL